MHHCSKAMSGLSHSSLLQCALLTATLCTSFECEYSVLSMHPVSITSKRNKFSWMLYWHIWYVQKLLHKCGFAPLFARCHFTVPSNQNLQGSRGVTTVCLVYKYFAEERLVIDLCKHQLLQYFAQEGQVANWAIILVNQSRVSSLLHFGISPTFPYQSVFFSWAVLTM